MKYKRLRRMWRPANQRRKGGRRRSRAHAAWQEQGRAQCASTNRPEKDQRSGSGWGGSATRAVCGALRLGLSVACLAPFAAPPYAPPRCHLRPPSLLSPPAPQILLFPLLLSLQFLLRHIPTSPPPSLLSLPAVSRPTLAFSIMPSCRSSFTCPRPAFLGCLFLYFGVAGCVVEVSVLRLGCSALG